MSRERASVDRMIPGDGDPRHGTSNGYVNLECRCGECRAANRAAMAQYYLDHPEQITKKRERMRHVRATRRAELTSVEQEKADKLARENARKREWRARKKQNATG